MTPNTNPPNYPMAVPLSEVADPQTLWDLALQGEALPEDDEGEA